MADLILEIVEGAEAGRQLPLSGPIDIGREPSLGLPLQDTQASRRHARVSLQNNAVVVEDLGSTNGTYVNDQPIQAPRVIQPGDRVRIGLTVLQLRSQQQVAQRASAVQPSPQITAVDQHVLQPAAPQELAPPPAAAAPNVPQVGVEETEPAFVPQEALGDIEAKSDYTAVARLVDTRVKRQTNIAVFALLGAAGLAVLLVFGLK
jgi:predicted component of type VI protein secretion system